MSGRRSATSTKVFVGRLPLGTTSEEILQLFAPYGEISECDVVNQCAFLHMEDQQLALKSVEELDGSMFKDTRISVEKGRVKPPPRRGNSGHGSNRQAPYSRNGGNSRNGSDFNRRGNGGFGNRGGGGGDRGRGRGRGGARNDNGYGDPYNGFDSGSGPGRGDPYERDYPRPFNDYNNGDRRFMDDRRYGPDANAYDMGYGGGGGGGGNRMYQDDDYERKPLMDDRPPLMDGRRPLMNNRNSLLGERRPLIDQQSAMSRGNNMPSKYDRCPPAEIYSRRDNSFPPQQRSYSGGPGARRDMPPARRY